MDHQSSRRRVQRVRHELHRRAVKVVRTARISPSFVSVTFAADSLGEFVSASFDDHLKFIFQNDNGETVRRDYTPRSFDPDKREATIEFTLHGDGEASNWARHARVGEGATIAGPRGSMIIPADYDWHLLAGDATALPAIHRRLEELPPGTRAIVFVQLDNAKDRREFSSAAQLDVTWLNRSGELLSALRALSFPSGEGFVWGAGEAAIMKEMRAITAGEKGHPKEAMRIAAYWRRGVSDFHEELNREDKTEPVATSA